MRTLLLACLVILGGQGAAQENDGQDQDAKAESQPRQRKQKPGYVWEKAKEQRRELEAKTGNEKLSPKERIAAAQELNNVRTWAKQQADKNPNKWEDQAGGADFFLQDGDYDRASECADRALEAGSPDGDPRLTAQVLLKRGAAKWYKGDVQGAFQDGMTALQMDPASREAVELVQYTKGRANRTEDGIASTSDGEAADKERLKNRLDSSVPHSKEEWKERNKGGSPVTDQLTRATRQREMGNFAAAIREGKAAVDLDPSDPMARAMLGFDQNKAGQHNDAIINLTHATQAGWDDPGLFTQRADALLKQGSAEAAKAALKDAELATQLDPKHADSWGVHHDAQLVLARGIQDNGQQVAAMGKALASLERAAQLDPAKYGSLYDQAKAGYGRLLERHAANEDVRRQQREKATAALPLSQRPVSSQEYAKREQSTSGKVQNRMENVVGHRLPDWAGNIALGVGAGVVGGFAAFGVYSFVRPAESPRLPRRGEIEILVENPAYREEQERYQAERRRRRNETPT